MPDSAESSLWRQWLWKAKGEDTEERRQRAQDERRRYEEAMATPAAQRAIDTARAKEACATALLQVLQCHRDNGPTAPECDSLGTQYFQCYRRERGFLRMAVLGMNVDLSPMVPLESDGEGSGVAAATPPPPLPDSTAADPAPPTSDKWS
mmetsp:Transcript_18845/g.49065  ORF Transcript_18845/g.49065 Transcript_18845/m.49065 type:complete len:150 (+) Transcript_18845:63-512(+)